MEFIRLISDIEYRKERLWIRVFLNLCGFCTNEQDASVSRDDLTTGDQSEGLIIFIGNNIPEGFRNKEHICIIQLNGGKYALLVSGESPKNIVWYGQDIFNNLFWNNLFAKFGCFLLDGDPTDKPNAIHILAACYNVEVMKSIYMLDDLYVSCRTTYSITKPLEDAVSALQAALGNENIRKRDTQDQFPRIAFACAFLAEKVNECVLRLNRPLIYTTASVLDIIKNKLGSYSYLHKALLLLESSILRNECLGLQQLQKQCEQIEREYLPGYKQQGIFLYAESRYDLLELSSGLRDDLMIDSYRRCVEDNPGHYRARYKIALCYERIGLKEHNTTYIRDAIREYEYISSLADTIAQEWKSAIEWEYGFKAKFRAALLLKRLNELGRAVNYLEKCEKEIRDLNVKGLRFCKSVYGGITQEVVQSKYIKTCQIIDNMLEEVRKEPLVSN